MEVADSIPLVPAWRGLSIGPAVVVVDELPWWDTPGSRRLLGLERITYSIRLPDRVGEVDCARCDARFQASGPTGHANDLPICDLCLLECQEELGLVMALVSVVRGYASVGYGSAREHWEALEEVGAFAHIFEMVSAARSGPPRIFRPKIGKSS